MRLRSAISIIVLSIVIVAEPEMSVGGEVAGGPNSETVVEINDPKNPPPGIQPPERLPVPRMVLSDYPMVSIQRQEQGTVGLRFLVLEDGSIGDVQVISPTKFPRLNNAALVYARNKWRFKPAMKDGNPIRVWLRDTVDFSLR